MKQIYEHCNHGALQPGLDELIGMLFTVTEGFQHAFVIIDALDECPKDSERVQLLKTISNLQTRSPSNVHVLVTSRRETDIEQALGSLSNILTVSLQGPQVDLDIHSHLAHQLATDPRLERWSKEVKAEIERTLMIGAKGM